MTEQLIDFKFSEYAGKLGMAFYYKKDFEKAKRLELAALLLLRRKTRAIIARKLDLHDELRAAERGIKKMSQDGIKFPLGEQRVKKLKQDLKSVRQELVEVGQATADALDLWQILGASLYELANLCNRSYAWVLREIGPDMIDCRFSELIFIYNLDYKSTLTWIDFCVDAPITHAVLAYHRDRIMNTAAGRQAADKALQKCFPDITESAMRMVIDENGVRHLIDKNGEIVTTLDDDL